MTNRMEQKKEQRKSVIENAAFELFCDKGIKKTSVDEIAQKAGVAKGTFYLYFSNKQKLIDELMVREAAKIIKTGAIERGVVNPNVKLDKKVILIVDYIIDYFQKNPKFLEFMHKNLYLGLIKKEHYVQLIKDLKILSEFKKMPDDDALHKKLYLVFELVGSCIYNAILFEEPYNIKDIKPLLEIAIKQIINI